MKLNVGNRVVYPCHGPCRIGAAVVREFGGRKTRFYPLAVLNDSGVVLFVPMEKAETLGIRRLTERAELLKLLGEMKESTETASVPTSLTNWKQRTADNSALLTSGSACDLAKLIGSLTELGEAKRLLPRDRQVLEEARKNLICEISEVLGESKITAERRLDDALKIKKEE